MHIENGLTLGIDLGIGSCGWAVIREKDGNTEIVGLGVRTFDVPETDKERTPTNQLRRQHRGMRKVLRRRQQRMNSIRILFKQAGLTSSDGKDALKISGLDPWRLRKEGLDRLLSGQELAVALGHIAKHRGFKSNSKRDRGANAPKESSEMLKTIEATREKSKTFRTVGEMFASDPEFADRKRNRDGDYTRSLLRADQEIEVKILLDRQRRIGNKSAGQKLEQQFIDLAFSQRPLADSESKVGACPFEPDEKRAAKRSPSFELFRLLSRLATLSIRTMQGERNLTPDEIAFASSDFGTQRGITYKRLRKVAGLHDDDRFTGVLFEDEGKRDVVARSGDAMPGSYALRKMLGDTGWRSLLAAPDKLDWIASPLSFRFERISILYERDLRKSALSR